MPDKYDSGKPRVIDVLHPSGDVHSIAVPPDLPLSDLHAALTENYQIGNPGQPAREGSLEYSPAFRDAANKAYGASARGMTRREAGFSVDQNGRPGPQTVHDSKPGEGFSDTITYYPNDLATLHTHPNVGGASQQPSQNDINEAKKARKTFYVVGADGLYAVDPGGVVSQVFKSKTWMTDKNPK